MRVIPEPLPKAGLDETGARMNEQPNFASALLAEEGFYRAFEAADPVAMMQVWGSAASITCIHPFGPLLVGVAAVTESWRAIFQGQPPCRVEVERVSLLNLDDLALHVVRENIFVPSQQRRFAPVFATNVYRKYGAEWRMVLHHASASPPEGGSAKTQGSRSPTRH